MDSFDSILQRAQKRKGGVAALESLLPVAVASRELKATTDDRYLAEMTKCIFRSGFVWQVVEGTPRTNRWRDPGEVPAETPDSKALSKLLKARGFRFVGPTICYAFMQAVGMVNDHTLDCFRYGDVG